MARLISPYLATKLNRSNFPYLASSAPVSPRLDFCLELEIEFMLCYATELKSNDDIL